MKTRYVSLLIVVALLSAAGGLVGCQPARDSAICRNQDADSH